MTNFCTVLVLCFVVIGIKLGKSEEFWALTITKKSKGLHIPIGTKKLMIAPAFEDYSDMMFQACDAMKLTVKGGGCNVYPMMTETKGIDAFATIYDGNKIIVYNRTLSTQIGYTGAMGVFAHELGHHYCRHLHKSPLAKHELEADLFVGASMRKAGYSLEETMSLSVLFSRRASKTHPKKSDRQKSIKKGWNNPMLASSCNK